MRSISNAEVQNKRGRGFSEGKISEYFWEKPAIRETSVFSHEKLFLPKDCPLFLEYTSNVFPQKKTENFCRYNDVNTRIRIGFGDNSSEEQGYDTTYNEFDVSYNLPRSNVLIEQLFPHHFEMLAAIVNPSPPVIFLCNTFLEVVDADSFYQRTSQTRIEDWMSTKFQFLHSEKLLEKAQNFSIIESSFEQRSLMQTVICNPELRTLVENIPCSSEDNPIRKLYRWFNSHCECWRNHWKNICAVNPNSTSGPCYRDQTQDQFAQSMGEPLNLNAAIDELPYHRTTMHNIIKHLSFDSGTFSGSVDTFSGETDNTSTARTSPSGQTSESSRSFFKGSPISPAFEQIKQQDNVCTISRLSTPSFSQGTPSFPHVQAIQQDHLSVMDVSTKKKALAANSVKHLKPVKSKGSLKVPGVTEFPCNPLLLPNLFHKPSWRLLPALEQPSKTNKCINSRSTALTSERELRTVCPPQFSKLDNLKEECINKTNLKPALKP